MYRNYPIATVSNLSRNFDSLFNSFFTPVSRMANCCATPASTMPAMHFSEDKEHYGVEVATPGVAPEDITISVTGNVLTVSNIKENAEEEAKKAEEVLKNGGEWHHFRFTRSVELPADIDASKISADYKHGVLHITIPKAEEVKPKMVEIKIH